jgi:hypothetical protein
MVMGRTKPRSEARGIASRSWFLGVFHTAKPPSSRDPEARNVQRHSKTLAPTSRMNGLRGISNRNPMLALLCCYVCCHILATLPRSWHSLSILIPLPKSFHLWFTRRSVLLLLLLLLWYFLLPFFLLVL